MIYFDNAATSYPKPASVLESLRHSINSHTNPGRGAYPLSANAASAVWAARAAAADFFGCGEPEKVIFTINATHALNIAIHSLGLERAHSIISCFEHNSVLRPMEAVSENGGSYSVFDVDLYDDDKTVRHVLELIRPETKAAVFTHISNVCGKILPLEKIINAIKSTRDDIIIIIDAAQSAGILEIDMSRQRIDMLCVPAHKGLYGIMGCGAIILGERIDPAELKPLLRGGSGTNSLDFAMPDFAPERFEAGTLNVPAIAAMRAGIEYVKGKGTDKIQTHLRSLYDYAFDILKEQKRIKIYSAPSIHGYTAVILFNIDGIDSESAAFFLGENRICVRAGYHCSPLAHRKLGTLEGGAIRISFGCGNKKSEIDRMREVLRKM